VLLQYHVVFFQSNRYNATSYYVVFIHSMHTFYPTQHNTTGTIPLGAWTHVAATWDYKLGLQEVYCCLCVCVSYNNNNSHNAPTNITQTNIQHTANTTKHTTQLPSTNTTTSTHTIPYHLLLDMDQWSTKWITL